MKRRFFSTSLILLFSFFTISSLSAFEISKDSLPDYNGYRLHLTNIEVVKKADDAIKIKYTAINTGRENLQLNPQKAVRDVQILFDESLSSSQLLAYEDKIREQLMTENLQLSAGQMRHSQELQFSPTGVFTERGSGQKASKTPKTVAPEPPAMAGKELCADIELSDLKLIKAGKRIATIQYTITNNGEGVANLAGNDRREFDDVAFRISVSTSKRLNKSSMIIGGNYLKVKKQPKLAPGQSYTETMKLDISKMTKYTPYLILEMDAYNSVSECDETNNKGTLRVRE